MKSETNRVQMSHIKKGWTSLSQREMPLHMTQNSGYKLLEPAFPEKNVAVFCSTSVAYALYCGVMLHSLLEHASPEWNYDLVVLESELPEECKAKIARLAEGRSNVSLRFFNMDPVVGDAELPVYEDYGIPVNAWYRIWAPEVFQRYERVVYLDLDILVQRDVAELALLDIGDAWLAACPDYGVRAAASDPKLVAYFRDEVGVQEVSRYVNDGVMLLNIRAMIRHRVGVDRLLAAAQKRFRWLDQDVFNHVCQGHIHYLDARWNALASRFFEHQLSAEDLAELLHAREHAAILHYVAGTKPWAAPEIDYASLWWAAARRSPYYEEIMFSRFRGMLRDAAYYGFYKRRHFWCRLVSHITWGKMRRKWEMRKRVYRACLLRAERALKAL